MTDDRARKRAILSRMALTGKSYSVAARRIAEDRMSDDDKLNDRYPRSGPDNDNRDPARDRRMTEKSDAVRTDWFKRGEINKSKEV